jgi:hypothetical protein
MGLRQADRPTSPVPGRLHIQPGTHPAKRPPTHRRVHPWWIPTQDPPLRLRGLRAPAHKSSLGWRSTVDVRVYFPIAWLPPGHDPGAGGGVAISAQQRDRIWPWDVLDRIRDFRVAARFREQRRDSRRGSGERLKRAWRLVQHRAIATSVAQANVS